MNLLASRNGRLVLFGCLYASEGAPIGFLWWALPTKLRAAGVPIEDIALLTSTLVLPWSFKFLWAPVVDVSRHRGWPLRGWIAASQTLMAATLLPLFFFDLAADFRVLWWILLLHACAAATQDVSVDALAIAHVPARDRGWLNGWMQAGMLAGRAALGGGALVLSEHIGDRAVYVLLIGIVAASLFLLALSREMPVRGPDRTAVADAPRAFVDRLRRAGRRRGTWLGLLFAGMSGAAFEGVGAVAGPYLIDRGFSTAQVGVFFAVPVILAMVAGALAGGRLSDRIGRRLSAGLFLCAFVLVILLLAAADAYFGAPGAVIIALLGALYFCIGLFTAASYALFMDLTDPGLGATQFSAFMGATNGCEAWASFGAGRLTGLFGYPTAFALLCVVSVAGLVVLWRMEAPDGKGG